MHHQGDAVKVNRLPSGVVHPKIKMLFIARREHHGCAPILALFAHALPQLISHTSTNFPHVHTKANFLQPLRQVAAQGKGAFLQNNDYQLYTPTSIPLFSSTTSSCISSSLP